MFPRALLLRSYDSKTPWFRVVPINTLEVLISWVNPRFFYAGTALDSKSEKRSSNFMGMYRTKTAVCRKTTMNNTMAIHSPTSKRVLL